MNTMFSDVQDEREEWVSKMFPGAPMPAHHAVLGAFEELSEWMQSTTEDEELDALADMVIFLLGWCTAHEAVAPDPIPCVVTTPTVDVAMYLGILARCQLKLEQAEAHGVEPRYKGRDFESEGIDAIGRLLHVLAVRALQYDRELADLVKTVWARVKERKRG